MVQEPSTPHTSPNSNLWTQLGVNCQKKPASAEVYQVDFVPKSIDSAIKYFRSQPRPLPPKFPRPNSGTPLSSRSTSMRCHGCHGIIGQGAHLGSGTGRNVCTLLHSNTCQGGIPDSDSFRACPPTYSFCPDANAAASGGNMDYAGAATPVNLNTSMSYAGNHPSSTPFSTPRQAVPGDIQRHVDDLRSRNQLIDHNDPSQELTIGDLRRDEGLKEVVSGIESSLKLDIPALSSAPTARMSPNGPLMQQIPQPGGFNPDIGGIAPLAPQFQHQQQPQQQYIPPAQYIPQLPSAQPAQDHGQQQQGAGGLHDGQQLGAIQKTRPTSEPVISIPQQQSTNPPVVSAPHNQQQQHVQVHPNGVSGHPVISQPQQQIIPLLASSPQQQYAANISPLQPMASDPQDQPMQFVSSTDQHQQHARHQPSR